MAFDDGSGGRPASPAEPPTAPHRQRTPRPGEIGRRPWRHLATQWRTLWAPSAGLVRRSDRFEAGAVLGSLLLAVLLVPLLAGLGLAVGRNLAADAARQRATGHSVSAVLLQDSPPVAVDASGELVAASARTPARWHLTGGGTRDGLVPADQGLRAGARVRIWLDASGWPAPLPLSPLRAAATGTLVGLGGWLGALAVLGLGCVALHHGLDRQRARAWAREWAALSAQRRGR
ncbi:hypothetical protein ACFUC1_01070 [Pedococcus sp. NPDC057267]|uniref:Rv1733c family protein n=1 Tax=Pedococcus sp. NPDC057267 TaxID=3346077 RepID=UPI00362E19F2